MADWAYNNRLAEIDWGSRGVNETAKVTKAVIRAHYGESQKKSYFIGCSTGGRMAAMEAQRFPDEFDGILSGSPALDYTGLVATHFAWLVQSNTGPDGKDILTKANAPLVSDAVARECGDAVGLVTDPAACTFKPASLTCRPGQNSECLSEAQGAREMVWRPKELQGRTGISRWAAERFGTLLAALAHGARARGRQADLWLWSRLPTLHGIPG
jgi:feruloyl esterase